MARSGKLFTFDLQPDDGEAWQVVADSRDIYMWERSNKGASFGGLKNNLHMGDLYAIAWGAARRQKLIEQGTTLADFIDRHRLEFDTSREPLGEADPDPTQSAASDER